MKLEYTIRITTQDCSFIITEQDWDIVISVMLLAQPDTLPQQVSLLKKVTNIPAEFIGLALEASRKSWKTPPIYPKS